MVAAVGTRAISGVGKLVSREERVRVPQGTLVVPKGHDFRFRVLSGKIQNADRLRTEDRSARLR